ncbi:MAG TPA: class I SAM-dependent methyltransferase, partial [Solirubrobacterales bacterium]|nr:class I SAM-dependent methyltransferase [Solirubrobacterales bacterium]
MTGSTADATSSEPTGERFDPLFMHGHLIEAEHLARYAWASQFAAGRKVLDGACGMAYGSAILAGAGASEVVGVDLDAEVVAKVSAAAKPNTRFEVADMRKLPFGDDEFDLVVSFETIEHVEDPETVLDELARVLKPGGLLVVSTPNRDVYTPGNPFHLRELSSNEFTDELSKRFASVAMRRQHTWVASGVFDDEAFRVGDNERLEGVELRKAVSDQPGEETYTIGIASDGELPVGTGLVSITADIDLRDWSARLDAADLALATAPLGGGSEAEVELLRTELAQLREQLAAAEGEHARFTEMEEKLAS